MGTWGPGLYSNDISEDVKVTYMDQLRRGKSNEEIIETIIKEYAKEIEDEEDAINFWLALADTQWKVGRLLPLVKEQALKYLESPRCIDKWIGTKELNKRKTVIVKLRNQLNSPTPPEKRIPQYRLYTCEWEIGDVFAYKFSEDYAKDKGYYGKSIVFLKVAEDTVHPGHIVPVVYLYKQIFDEDPSIDHLKDAEYMPQFYSPEAYQKNKSLRVCYKLILYSSSPKNIPTDRLKFLGKITSVNHPTNQDQLPSFKYWKDLEKYIINLDIMWK